jgi:hypothetical protein
LAFGGNCTEGFRFTVNKNFLDFNIAALFQLADLDAQIAVRQFKDVAQAGKDTLPMKQWFSICHCGIIFFAAVSSISQMTDKSSYKKYYS